MRMIFSPRRGLVMSRIIGESGGGYLIPYLFLVRSLIVLDMLDGINTNLPS